MKGSYIIYFTFHHLKSPPFGQVVTVPLYIWGRVVSQGMLAKSWTQNSCHPLKVFVTHPPNFIPLSKKRKNHAFRKKDRGYTTTSFPSSRPHLTFKKKTWHLFRLQIFATHRWVFFRLSLVVGLLQEQVAPRGRFPSTTDDKQESLQKTGAHLGGWFAKKPTDFRCFFAIEILVGLFLGILLLAYERTPTALTV